VIPEVAEEEYSQTNTSTITPTFNPTYNINYDELDEEEDLNASRSVDVSDTTSIRSNDDVDTDSECKNKLTKSYDSIMITYDNNDSNGDEDSNNNINNSNNNTQYKNTKYSPTNTTDASDTSKYTHIDNIINNNTNTNPADNSTSELCNSCDDISNTTNENTCNNNNDNDNDNSDEVPTALIVDDNPINVKVLRHHLGSAGFNVRAVTSGEDAVNETEQRPYDLVFLDVYMPGIGGIEAARRISKLDRAPKMIVGCSADTRGSIIAECRAAGMAEFLPKPFKKQAISQLYSSIVLMKKAEKEHVNMSTASCNDYTSDGGGGGTELVSEMQKNDLKMSQDIIDQYKTVVK